jgi:hypothetical protein
MDFQSMENRFSASPVRFSRLSVDSIGQRRNRWRLSDNRAAVVGLIRSRQPWADRAELLAAWPTLPEAIKTGILAMIRTAAR